MITWLQEARQRLLPRHLPKYCRDLKQLCDALGGPNLPANGKGEHNALLDARWNKQAHAFLVQHATTSTPMAIT